MLRIDLTECRDGLLGEAVGQVFAIGSLPSVSKGSTAKLEAMASWCAAGITSTSAMKR